MLVFGKRDVYSQWLLQLAGHFGRHLGLVGGQQVLHGQRGHFAEVLLGQLRLELGQRHLVLLAAPTLAADHTQNGPSSMITLSSPPPPLPLITHRMDHRQ